MEYQPNPNDPFRGDPADEQVRRQVRLENELQPDPELTEGPSSGGRVVMFAVAIAAVLGAVFYGLNQNTINQAGTTPPAQTAQTQPANPPAAPPGMRDVTPRAGNMPNTEPGMTTGGATNRPTPPSPSPTGPTVDRPATPPTGQNAK
jgi:hypothetical protein